MVQAGKDDQIVLDCYRFHTWFRRNYHRKNLEDPTSRLMMKVGIQDLLWGLSCNGFATILILCDLTSCLPNCLTLLWAKPHSMKVSTI